MFARSPYPTVFYGDPNTSIASIDVSGGINMSRTSGQTPAFVHVSASAILATGSVLDGSGNPIGGAALRPYERLEYNWDFGDVTGTEVFTDPFTGILRNANHDQWGPEAVYCYRNAGTGTYTITLRIRGKSGSGYVYATATKTFTVTTFNASGGSFYYDSINGNDAWDGTHPNNNNGGGQGPKQTLWGTTSAISGAGQVNGTNIAIYLAYGSSWPQSARTLKFNSGTSIRIAAYPGAVPGSVIKPKLITSSDATNGCVDFQSGPTNDVVLSNLDISVASSATIGGTVVNLSRSGNASAVCIFVGSISNGSGGAGTHLVGLVTSVDGPQNILKGLNLASNGCTILDGTGNITNTTKINSFTGSATTVDTSQLVASETMVATKSATVAVFIGSITSNVLTITSNAYGISPAQNQVLIDLTGNVGARTMGTNIDATHWNVSSGADVSSQLMVSGTPGTVVQDVYFDNLNVHNDMVSTGGSGMTLYGGGPQLFNRKSDYQRMSIYGCTVTAITGSASYSVGFGAAQWMSWFGSHLSATGSGVASTIHQVNPENTNNFALMRWVTIDSAGVVPSGLNYCFEPRANNWYNGTLAGDYVGGNFLVADSLLGYGTNGINFTNENNQNPSTQHGYYTGCVVERCNFGPITNATFNLNGVSNLTVRDNQVWGTSNFFGPVAGTNSVDQRGLAGWLASAVYHNWAYRPPNVTTAGLTGSSEHVSEEFVSFFPSGDAETARQEFSYNIIWDDRPGGGKPPVLLAAVFSGQAAVSSPFHHNQYYAPGSTTYMIDGATGKTLAQWQAAGVTLDPDAIVSMPSWADPVNGKF